MTICVECKWHEAIRSSRARSVPPMGHRCMHSSNVVRWTDPVTGHVEVRAVAACEDINKGDCPHWEKK